MKFNKSSLLKDTLIYGLGDFLVTGVSGFLLLPLYVEYLTQDQYGLFGLFNMNLTIFTYIIQLGLVSGFSRVYFMHERPERHGYLNAVLSFHLAYSLVLTAFFYLGGSLLRKGLSPALPKELFNLAYLNAFFGFLPALFSVRYRLNLDTRKFVTLQVVTVVLLIIAVFYTLLIMKGSLPELLSGMVISNGLVWLYFLVTCLPNYRPSLPPAMLRDTFKIAVPVFFSYLMLFFVNKFSLVILQRHVPLSQIGLFSFFQQLSGVLLIISVAAGKAIQPIIFSSKVEELNYSFNKMDKLYKQVLFLISALLIVFTKEFIHLLFNDAYTENLSVFYVLVISTFLFTSILLQNTILQYFLKSKWLFYCVFISGLVSLASNYLLVPRFYIYGGAISVLLSFLVMAFLNYYYTQKLIKPANQFSYLLIVVKLAGIAALVLLFDKLTSIMFYASVKALLAGLLLVDFSITVRIKTLIKGFKGGNL